MPWGGGVLALRRKIVASLLVGLLSIFITPNVATASSVEGAPEEFYAVYISPDGSESIYRPSEDDSLDSYFRSRFVGPTWAACGLHDSDNKIVHQYVAGRTPLGPEFLRRPNLRCGNGGFGYRHIKLRHAGDWENLAGRVGGNWRDFASFAISSSLSSPTKACIGGHNDVIYIGTIEIRSSNGAIGERYYPKVPVGRSTNNIITAFPQKNMKGCP